MAEKSETAWVFDALVGFLQGPFWSTSILNFIEEKSLIFEPETLDSKEYREIHQEYKNFVNLLLDCHMEDMGITPEQFEQACSLIKNTQVSIKFQQGLFEQIWAANEYEVFIRMMIQKNLELQLQSLKMIEQKYGLTPASLTHEPSELFNDELPTEELLQKETEAINEKIQSDENVDVKKDEHGSQIKQEQCATKPNLKTIHEVLNKSTDESFYPEDNEEKTKFNVESVSAESSNRKESDAENHAAVFGNLSIINSRPISPMSSHEELNIKPKEETSEQDILDRQLYLKAQRDKLVALKKARNLKLRTNTARPNSARTFVEATIDSKQQDLIAHQQAMDESILQVRKALAARLKAEVVQK